MRHPIPTLLALAATLFLAPAIAQAHVGVTPSEVPAGATRTFSFDVPHGCAGQATTSVALRIPAGFVDVEPRPKSGWTLDVRSDTDGATIATWSGGSFPDGTVEAFRVRMTTPSTPDTAQYIPAVQECVDGRYRWIQLPTDGERYEDLETPAPRILLGALAPAQEGDEETTTATTTATPLTEPEPEPIPEAEPQDTVAQAAEASEAGSETADASSPTVLITVLVLVVATASVIVGFAIARRRRT